jgi:hypothetical protein
MQEFVLSINSYHLMHQASENIFKSQGGGKCTGACLRLQVSQARIRRCQSKSNSLPDVPQVVVESSLLPQPLLRFLDITICHVMLMRVQG